MPILVDDTWTNIGTDLTAIVIDNDTNLPVSLGGRVTNVDPKKKETLVTNEGLDNGGIPDYRQTHDGWEVTFTINRSNDDLDILVAQIELGCVSTPATQKRFTLQDNMVNGTASSTVFQTLGCVMMTETIGSRKKKDITEMRVTFHGKTRQPIAG